LSIPLFDEDGSILYDCLFIYNNLDVDSLQIYNRLRYRKTCIIGFPICYSFTDTNCGEAVRSRIIELMQKNPNISSSELVKITGHSKPTIIRYYMNIKWKKTKMEEKQNGKRQAMRTKYRRGIDTVGKYRNKDNFEGCKIRCLKKEEPYYLC
jgi:hypothetical protein